MARTKIAVACRSHVERGTIIEWLDSGGYHAIPVPVPTAPPRDLEALGFEMLIIDSDLMTVGSLALGPVLVTVATGGGASGFGTAITVE